MLHLALGASRCGSASGILVARVLEEISTIHPTRRVRLLRELEQKFALNIPSADKRAAYALEHIAFGVARIKQSLGRIATAIESVLSKP